MIASRLSPDLVDKRDIQSKIKDHNYCTLIFSGHYEKIFKNCHLKYQGDGPTGILLIYPQHAIHCLEAPLELLNTVIADLEDIGKNKYPLALHFLIFFSLSLRALLCDSRLLNFSTGLEQRFYPQWCARQLNLPSLAKGEVYQTNDPIEQTVGRFVHIYTCTSIISLLSCISLL